MKKTSSGSKLSKVAVYAAAMAFCTAAYAQQLNLKIPPGDLETAINAYMAATGVQLVYRSADLKGHTSKGVQGSMTASQALEKLLEGTNLKMRRDDSGAVVIFPSETHSGAVSDPESSASPVSPQVPDKAITSVVVYGNTSHLASQTRTGTRMDADPMTIPLNVTTVEKGLLEQQQSLNLRDAIANVAGVTALDGNGTYSMRGFTAGLMRNGNIITSPNGMDVPVMAVSRLEVVKGPEAIIAGVNAGYGGVINIISKTPQVAPLTEFAATVGSHGYYETGVDLGRPLNEGKTLLGRVVMSTQGSGVNAYGYDGPRNDYIAPSLTWRNKATHTEFTAQYEYQNKRTPGNPAVLATQSALSGDLPIVGSGRKGDGVDAKNRVATLSVNQYLGGSWDLTVNYADERRRNEGADATIVPSQLFGLPPGNIVFFGTRNDSTYDSKSLKLELKGEVETGPLTHKVLFAYDRALRHIEAGSASLYLNSVDPGTNVVTDLVPTLGAIFGVPSPRLGGGGDPAENGALVLDQVQWGDWIALAGWRMMRYDANTWNMALPQFKRSLPSLGLLYRVSNTFSVYGNVAKGFVPNAGNLGFNNTTIPPEDAKQGELGVKWLMPERKAAFTASVFNIQQKNVAVPDPLHNGLQCGGNVCYISVKGVHSQGAELEYSGQLIPHVEVRANYTYLNKNSETENLSGVAYAKHTFNVWGTYRFSADPARGWWVGAGLQSRSARNAMPGWAANPGNGRVDLNTGYDANNWSFVGGVKNVADKRLYTLQSGVFLIGNPYQPREFFLTARYHFQ